MNTENIFLVKRAQRRDKDAFCELMDLQMKDMYRVAIAILASEEDRKSTRLNSSHAR